MCLLPTFTAARNFSPACQQLVHMLRIPSPGSDGHKYFGQTLLTQSCPTASQIPRGQGQATALEKEEGFPEQSTSSVKGAAGKQKQVI